MAEDKNMTTRDLKKTSFCKGWTRFNCLNKGYIVPEWAMEGIGRHQRELCERHNEEVRKRLEDKDGDNE